LRQLENAESIYPQSSSLHYLKALAQIKSGFPTEAEQELRTSLNIEPSDEAWLALARLYRQQGRYPEAAAVLGPAVKLSPTPFELYMELGVVQMDMGLPEQALASFDEVEKRSPFVDEAASLGAEFNRQMAEARANAWRKLAEMYQERGLRDDALRAMQQATSLQTFADSIGQQ
jgi:tetratricopeptide (TPR) repeat protein